MAEAAMSAVGMDGLIIELGAGTGPVTEALLRNGIPPDRLIVVEKQEKLAEMLRARFPSARVLCRSADDLADVVDGSPVAAVVSSLPFRSLPEQVCTSIMSEVERMLSPDGLYIQFTYALLGELPFAPRSFEKLRSAVVWLNMPPAKVVVFRKPR